MAIFWGSCHSQQSHVKCSPHEHAVICLAFWDNGLLLCGHITWSWHVATTCSLCKLHARSSNPKLFMSRKPLTFVSWLRRDLKICCLTSVLWAVKLSSEAGRRANTLHVDKKCNDNGEIADFSRSITHLSPSSVVSCDQFFTKLSENQTSLWLKRRGAGLLVGVLLAATRCPVLLFEIK